MYHRNVSGFDPKSPNVARVYDALVGGKDNFEPDRGAVAILAEIAPQITELAAENRQFQARAVTWLANQGITQFLDLGCGMPAEPNTHETAQEANPDARVAYVDIDPVAANHMTTFVRPGSGVTAVRADASDPAGVRAALDGALDFTQPVAVLMGALLHFYPAPAAREIVTGTTGDLAPGSYLTLSVIAAEGKVMDRLIPAYSAAIAPLYPYTEDETAGLLDGLDLVPPGIAPHDTWRPGWAEAPPPKADRDFFGHVAVARVGAPAPRDQLATITRNAHGHPCTIGSWPASIRTPRISPGSTTPSSAARTTSNPTGARPRNSPRSVPSSPSSRPRTGSSRPAP